jgi:hypothetical protein
MHLPSSSGFGHGIPKHLFFIFACSAGNELSNEFLLTTEVVQRVTVNNISIYINYHYRTTSQGRLRFPGHSSAGFKS